MTNSMVSWTLKQESKDRKSIMSFSYSSGMSQTKILGAHRQISISSVLVDTMKIQTSSNQVGSVALRAYIP